MLDRLSVAMDAELGRAVRSAAKQAGLSVSRWMTDAAEDHLRNQLLGAALDTWQAENGVLTVEELAAAERRLGGEPAESERRRAG